MKGQSTEATAERITAGQLALEVMHEIRNPLEALGHLVYLSAEGSQDAAKVQKYMRMAEEQLDTINQIVSQTLAFARTSTVPKTSDLVKLAEAALRIHQRTIDEKKIHLVKDLAPEVVAEVRSGEIIQVVSNLIVNALDALPARGVLAVRLRQRRSGAHIIVSDNGHGIKAEHVRVIFEPFFTTKEEKGNGLGLALSKRIIERHGGKIWVRSCVRPGKTGTTFRIFLPA